LFCIMPVIEEVIENYIYKNEETGYSVISLSGGTKAVGILPDIPTGTTVRLTGNYEMHAFYGEQFKIEELEVLQPTDKKSIIDYLSSGAIKGIGKGMALRIVAMFGSETFNVMDNNIEKLLDINGVGRRKLEQIKKGWESQKAIKDVMMFLQEHGVSRSQSVKIFKIYGPNAIEIVKQNPYQLSSDVWGMGFKTADKIGKSMGFEGNHPARVRSGVIYILKEAAGEGHVFLPLADLYARCTEVLELDLAVEYNILRDMDDEGSIILRNDNVYLTKYYTAEKNVEQKIRFMNGLLNNIGKNDIKKIIINEDYYSEEQIGAITNALQHKLLIVTGGPGTGKTTTLKGIISAYQQLDKSIMLAAPTGRAAKRMSEVIGLKASTIHRLLEYNPNDSVFARNENYPLECNLLIIDEMSMIDILLFNSLLRAVTEDTTLILVGDVDQLPSVGAGNVLGDLLKADIIPSINLTKIFRQAEESKIIVNSHRINKGEMPIIQNNENSDFFFINESEDKNVAELIVNLCGSRLSAKYGYDPMTDIQVLTPMYKGEAGADNLNKMLQAALNKNKIELERGDKSYKTGDKVMQLKNNYTKEVFNGDIGIIESINIKEQKAELSFNGRIIEYDLSEFDEITLAYAITVHKSQGSEYPCVILPLSLTHYIMLQRNLLYTAVTRAAKTIILIGPQRALYTAIHNKKSVRRYTSLFAD